MSKRASDPSPNPSLGWLFFSFRGRIARQSYTLACLFNLVLLVLAIYQSVQGVEAVKSGGTDGRLIFAGLLSMVVIAFGVWSILALSVKRMHDLDHPAALVIILFVAPVNVFFTLYLMARTSHPQSNEHGPPPFAQQTTV